MPFNFPRGIEVVLKAHRGIDQRAHVMHFLAVEGVAMATAVEAAADLVFNWAQDFYAVALPNVIVFDEVRARDLTLGSTIETVFNFTNVAGGSTSPAMPGNVTQVATLHTPIAGRSGRGRLFLFEAREDDYDATNQKYTSAAVTLKQAVVDQLISDSAASASAKWCVMSRTHGQAAQITSAKVHDYIATQEDRLPGHRRRTRRPATP